MERGSTHYETFQVREDASIDVIRASYRQLIKDAHPDRIGGDVLRAQQLNEALSVLSDPTLRAAYDKTIDIALPAGPAPAATGRHRRGASGRPAESSATTSDTDVDTGFGGQAGPSPDHRSASGYARIEVWQHIDIDAIQALMVAHAGMLMWSVAIVTPYMVMAAAGPTTWDVVVLMAVLVGWGWWAGHPRTHGAPRGARDALWLFIGVVLAAAGHSSSAATSAVVASIFALWVPATEWSYRCIDTGR